MKARTGKFLLGARLSAPKTSKSQPRRGLALRQANVDLARAIAWRRSHSRPPRFQSLQEIRLYTDLLTSAGLRENRDVCICKARSALYRYRFEYSRTDCWWPSAP